MDRIERARESVRAAERAVVAAQSEVRFAAYADGPRAYQERAHADADLAAAKRRLKDAQASLERELAQQVA